MRLWIYKMLEIVIIGVDGNGGCEEEENVPYLKKTKLILAID